MTEEALSLLALNLVPGLGPVRIGRLLKAFTSAAEVLQAKPFALQQVVGAPFGEAILHARKTSDAEAEWERTLAFGAKILTLMDSEYPALLLQMAAPPPILYIWGNLQERDRHAIAVVGTRDPTPYGVECAKKLSFQLAYSGVTIVSGLARGVDSFAHQGAMAAQGRTIAVLGSGLCRIYPSENQNLAERIATSFGAVISELPMLTVANRKTFPARNRIVSGLSLGTLVVEAGVRSGALITANAAADQGRSVYAIPGRIDHLRSAGSNALLQQGAKLVTGAQDILDDFALLFREPPVLPQPPEPEGFSSEQKKIFFILGSEALHLDEVASKAQLPVALTSSTLLSMELEGVIKQLPGCRFIKVVS